jgi:hypothetical protein
MININKLTLDIQCIAAGNFLNLALFSYFLLYNSVLGMSLILLAWLSAWLLGVIQTNFGQVQWGYVTSVWLAIACVGCTAIACAAFAAFAIFGIM